MSRAAEDEPWCVDELSVLGPQLKLDVLSQAHMTSILCNDCASGNVTCGRCVCLQSVFNAKEFKFPASEKSISDFLQKATWNEIMG